MSDDNIHFEVSRGGHAKTRIVEAPLTSLADGRARLRVERFALTANNVTYATFGDLLGYWDFFPTEAHWGRVPAMGWGSVVESAHPDVAVGGRYFGWYPMSRYLDLAVSATADGLRDEGAHRVSHAPIYRGYVRTDRDPFHQAGEEAEDRHALLRGLFLTAFLADDFFAEHGYYDARRVVVLSASSKTAIGFAQRASAQGLDEVIGVTSPANVPFVEALGWYDRVVTYDAIDGLATDSDAVSIDMAGNADVLERLHARLGDRLRYSMTVGKSHHDTPMAAEPSCGPRPEMFFAPSQVEKRLGDWGPDGYRKRVADALREFVDGSRRWLDLERSYGPEATTAAWLATLDGRVPPRQGSIVSLAATA